MRKASGNIELEITYLDGERMIERPLTGAVFESEDDARGSLERLACDTLTETPDACSVLARTSAYPGVWAEAYDQGDGPIVASGTDEDDA